MGSITGEWASNQASATCVGVARYFMAIWPRAPPALITSPPSTGRQGMKATSSSEHASSTGSEDRSNRLYRFCTETIGVSFCARSSSSTVTFERPMCRIFPSFFSCTRVPTDSSNGTCGSGR